MDNIKYVNSSSLTNDQYDDYKRYRFVKEYKKSETEKIPVGSEVTIMNGRVYFNGGMTTPLFTKFFLDLIELEKKNSNYLKEVPIPYNKV